jgi:hypothetical protein
VAKGLGKTIFGRICAIKNRPRPADSAAPARGREGAQKRAENEINPLS